MPVTASAAPSASAADPPVEDERSKSDKAHRRGCAARLWQQFSKQETPGHRTIFSLRFAIIIFAIMCVGFLAGGATLLTISLKQVQIRVRYSDVGPLADLTCPERSTMMQGTDPTTGEPVTTPMTSTLVVTVEKDMDSPVHVYYILGDFYQNHKRYVRSVSYDQLHGGNPSGLQDCVPQRWIGSEENASLPQMGQMNPCGLTAWSLFNDSFTDFSVIREGAAGPVSLTLDQTDLVWASDRDTFFGNYAPINHNTIPEYRGGRELVKNISQDELFMGWMRPAAHPTVRKFYGVFHEDLKAGDRLQFLVTHQYNTYGFCGEKSLLLTTQSAFGNRNVTFGLVWLVMGVLCGIITITYIVLGREQLRDPSARRRNLERWWKMSAMASAR